MSDRLFSYLFGHLSSLFTLIISLFVAKFCTKYYTISAFAIPNLRFHHSHDNIVHIENYL